MSVRSRDRTCVMAISLEVSPSQYGEGAAFVVSFLNLLLSFLFYCLKVVERSNGSANFDA
jgi:hypothetical protein